MIVTCEACDTKYQLADEQITGAGTKVRCSICQHMFKVYPASTAGAATPSDDRTPPEHRKGVAASTETQGDQDGAFFSDDDFESFLTSAASQPAAQPSRQTDRTSHPPDQQKPDDGADQTLDGFEFENLLDQDVAPRKTDDAELKNLTDDLEKLFQSDDFPKDTDGAPAEETSGLASTASDEELSTDFELPLEMETPEPKVTPETSRAPEHPGSPFEDEMDEIPEGPRVRIEIPSTPAVAAGAASPEKPFEAKSAHKPSALRNQGQPRPAPEAPRAATAAAPPPRKSRRWLVMLLVLVVLAAGAFGLYSFFYHTPFSLSLPSIPFLDRFKTSDVDESGRLRINILDRSDRFVENVRSGNLFVVSGKVRNDYSMPRKLIKINGNLFSRDQSLVQSQVVIAGNQLSDQELTELDIATMGQRLQQTQPTAGLTLQPGQAMGFMIVFWNLPADLEKYTLEIVESLP